ncbi:hypothetical protein [Bartonella vinsonii]|uniref:Uncharacterized protein conserved in bacteria n=1 Tax=Bartonella vinsonii TaxID=33047 RepID=A0A3S4YW98_BARVI|nr:hypothetical protein [Bartonella vinsonii]VEJ46066.1 Uncharacterized protein conserved in bacteria [Bartonella vinsonii]
MSEATRVANEAKAAAEQAVQADRQVIASQDVSVKQLAQEAKSTAEEAKKVAEGVQKKAESLATVVDESQKTAKEAKDTAGYAKHDAEQARSMAEAAKNEASGATSRVIDINQVVDNFKAPVSLARTYSEEAKEKAESAASQAYQAKSEAEKAKEVANSAKRTAEEAKKTADTTKQELGGIKSSLETATTAHTVASQAKVLGEEVNNLLKQSNLTVLSISTPFLVATGKSELTLKKGTHITLALDNNTLVASYTADTRISVPYLSAGKNYYVYLVFEGEQSSQVVVSENSTYPSDYTVSNSRKIGGFHTLCADVGTIDGHPLSGYSAGDILPNSVWCLNHCPHSSPEGMVYDLSQDLWVDIYLQSGTGANTRSAHGVAITINRSYTDFADDLRCVKKFLLNDEQFASAMYGSNDRTSIQGKKSPSPKHSGGHVDTADRRMISHIGCEDGCGYIWQFLAGTFPMQIASVVAGRNAFRVSMNVLVGGGSWSHDPNCGAYIRSANHGRTLKSDQVGARGCSRPRRYV